LLQLAQGHGIVFSSLIPLIRFTYLIRLKLTSSNYVQQISMVKQWLSVKAVIPSS